MERITSRLFHWVYYLAAALYFLATVLRTLLINPGGPLLDRVLFLLLLGLLFFISEPAISHRWPGYFPIYLLIQTTLVFLLLSSPGSTDFYAMLLSLLSMQAMLNLNPRIGGVWIGACAVIMWLLMKGSYGYLQAAALTLIFTALSIFTGAYALSIRRQQAAQHKQVALVSELQAANQQLQEYSFQQGRLAVARERNRFARELHDSVTQTVFSMTLTTQSALLLFERDRSQVNDQLERLSQLVRSALAEMQALIAELKSDLTAAPGLIPALRRHLADPRIAGKLSVSLWVEGEASLTVAEQQALLGIAQEALNNIVKHAQVEQADIRLHLAAPYWMEIADQGPGFDLQRARNSGQMGLTSMQERAAEIGWDLQINTTPGAGTCIRVEKPSDGEERI